MWKLIRMFIRAEVLSWMKKEFTQDKLQKLVERALKSKLGTKKMRTKLAVGLRAELGAAGIDITAAAAQSFLKGVLDDLVEQML